TSFLFVYSSNGASQPSSRSSILVTTNCLRFSGRTRNVLIALFKASCLSAASMTPRCSARLLRMIETCHHAIAYRSPRSRVGGHSGFFAFHSPAQFIIGYIPLLGETNLCKRQAPPGVDGGAHNLIRRRKSCFSDCPLLLRTKSPSK